MLQITECPLGNVGPAKPLLLEESGERGGNGPEIVDEPAIISR
jgi:hypothetical protein